MEESLNPLTEPWALCFAVSRDVQDLDLVRLQPRPDITRPRLALLDDQHGFPVAATCREGSPTAGGVRAPEPDGPVGVREYAKPSARRQASRPPWCYVDLKSWRQKAF